MKIDFNSMKVRTVINLIIAFILAIMGVLLIVHLEIQRKGKEAVMAAEEDFKQIQGQDLAKLSATLETFLTNREMQQLFRRKRREKLYETTLPLFARLKEQYRVSDLSFYNPGYLRDIDLDEMERSRRWLERAVEKTKTEKQQARAQLLHDAFEYYEATAHAYKAHMDAPKGLIRTEDQALAMLEGIEKSALYAERRRHLALEVFPDHPVLVHPIPITRNASLAGESWGASSIWKVYDLVAENEVNVALPGASVDLGVEELSVISGGSCPVDWCKSLCLQCACLEPWGGPH